jgi:hypothetical protein
MKLKELLENNLYEDLNLVKFKYSNYKEDPSPKVKVLDFEYPGQKGQKTYGKRKDLLGFNLNYFKNKRYAARAIDEIDGFARLLSANKKEKYQRLKYFYPEVTKFIRRYQRQYINNIKHKKRFIWRGTSYNDLIKYDKDNF